MLRLAKVIEWPHSRRRRLPRLLRPVEMRDRNAIQDDEYRVGAWRYDRGLCSIIVRGLLTCLVALFASFGHCHADGQIGNSPKTIPCEVLLDLPQFEGIYSYAWDVDGAGLCLIVAEKQGKAPGICLYRYDTAEHSLEPLDIEPWARTQNGVWLDKNREAVFCVGNMGEQSIVRMDTTHKASRELVYEPPPGWVLSSCAVSWHGSAIAAVVLKNDGDEDTGEYYVLAFFRDEGFKERPVWGSRMRCC